MRAHEIPGAQRKNVVAGLTDEDAREYLSKSRPHEQSVKSRSTKDDVESDEHGHRDHEQWDIRGRENGGEGVQRRAPHGKPYPDYDRKRASDPGRSRDMPPDRAVGITIRFRHAPPRYSPSTGASQTMPWVASLIFARLRTAAFACDWRAPLCRTSYHHPRIDARSRIRTPNEDAIPYNSADEAIPRRALDVLVHVSRCHLLRGPLGLHSQWGASAVTEQHD
jgi:hypothetical protein